MNRAIAAIIRFFSKDTPGYRSSHLIKSAHESQLRLVKARKQAERMARCPSIKAFQQIARADLPRK